MHRDGKDALERAQSLERARFAGSLAHEVRGHLTDIGLATTLSRRALDQELPTRASSYLDRIEERVRDLAELVDDLQDLLGAGPVLRAALPAVTSLPSLLETAFERARAVANTIGVGMSVRPAEDVRLELDVAKTRRLATLLALELAETGAGGSLDVRAETTPAGRGRVALVLELHRRPRVGDAHLAEPARATAALVTSLATVLGAVVGPRAATNGTIVQRLTLPARLVAAEAPIGPDLEGLEGARLLVVEDDRDARSALVLLLEDWGFEVVESESGSEGAEAGLRRGARLALLDIEMPRHDGFAVRDLLRARDPLMPVIFLSGSERHMATDDPDLRTRYLMKPVELDSLESALRELLQARRESEAATRTSAARPS